MSPEYARRSDLPPIDAPQNMVALAGGNTVRLERARLRKETNALHLADGREHVANLLDRREPGIQSMNVRDLLKWVRRNSDMAVDQALGSAGILWDNRRVRDLTDRQNIALQDALLLQAEGTRMNRKAA